MKNKPFVEASAFFAAALVLGAAANAQQAPPAAPSTPGKDVQARFEPPSGPGAGQEYPKKFEGEWTVERIFCPPPGGSPSRASGEATQKMVQEGRFLESDFTFRTADGKTSTGTGIGGFDPNTGLFTTFWYDSRSTRFSVRQSRETFDGKQIVLYSVSLSGSHGQEHVSRTVSFLEDGGKRLVHRQYNADASGNEKVLMELILTRKGT